MQAKHLRSCCVTCLPNVDITWLSHKSLLKDRLSSCYVTGDGAAITHPAKGIAAHTCMFSRLQEARSAADRAMCAAGRREKLILLLPGKWQGTHAASIMVGWMGLQCAPLQRRQARADLHACVVHARMYVRRRLPHVVEHVARKPPGAAAYLRRSQSEAARLSHDN